LRLLVPVTRSVRHTRSVLKQLRLRRLMTAKPQFAVHFSRTTLAASLWSFGEDELADRALELSDDDLRRVQAIAGHYEDPDHPLPVEGQRISHGHVMALAAVTFLERELRPLARNRRRPQRDRPARFEPLPPDPATGL
jgi:hypothetical protein